MVVLKRKIDVLYHSGLAHVKRYAMLAAVIMGKMPFIRIICADYAGWRTQAFALKCM
jgi:hypothetical protein